MLKKLLRLSAALIAPALMAGAAHAEYGYEDPAYQAYGADNQGEAALILYRGENFTGEAREIYDPIYALPDLAFNDRARSVAVLAGQWEICEHSDFTGRCVFLRYDVPDLSWYGLSRQASSVRPVYEYTEAEHGLMFTRDRNGYIRYADNERYGYDDYRYGYGVSTGISVYHYGYSPEYVRYGYYDPRLGYDPYGFGWHGIYGSSYYNTYRRELPPLRGHYGARDGTVTLYTDSYGRGASFGLNRAVSDLSRYRFNDNVSSINIRSGTWEVCTDANFRGTCRIIDASTDRLNGIRLNDNISSIRPVGGNGYGGGNWTPGSGHGGHGPGTGDGGHGPGGDGHGDRGPRPGGTTPGNWGDRGGHGDRGGPGPNGTGQTLTGTGVSAPATPPAIITPPRTSPPPPRVTTPPGVARVNRDLVNRDPAPRDVRPMPRELAGGAPTPQTAVSPPRGSGVRPALRDTHPPAPRAVTPPPQPRFTPPARTSAPQVSTPQPARPAYTPPPAAPAPQPRPQVSSPPPQPRVEPSRPAVRDSRPPALRGRDKDR
ncbi:MAG: beta/gamma crystallin-related protein [Hyphomonas sp.]